MCAQFSDKIPQNSNRTGNHNLLADKYGELDYMLLIKIVNQFDTLCCVYCKHSWYAIFNH